MLNLRTVAIQSSLFIEVGSTYRRVVLSAKKIKIVVVLNINYEDLKGPFVYARIIKKMTREANWDFKKQAICTGGGGPVTPPDKT